MKSKHRFVLICLLTVGLVGAIQSQVPQLINYQGRMDSAGVAVNGTRSITFSIYNVPTGGTSLWSETNSAVTVTSGVFNVLLGSVNPIQTSLFMATGDRYLEMNIAGVGAMAPRFRFTSSPYTMRAAQSDTAAYAYAAPNSGLGGTGTANYLPMFTGTATVGNSRLYQAVATGNIGINTTSPSNVAELHVQSNNRTSGLFTADSAAASVGILQAEYTGPKGTSYRANAYGILGRCFTDSGYGYGGRFEGGRYGVSAVATSGYGITGYGLNATATSSSASAYGVYGIGTGASSYSSIGVYGYANGGAYAYGVYGTASTGTNRYAGYFSGDLAYTGVLTDVSDSRLKVNVRSLENTLSKLMQLQTHSYEFTPSSEYMHMNLAPGKHFGLVAQEVERIFPELVTDNMHPAAIRSIDERESQEGPSIAYKGINYIELIPILIKAVQSQQMMIQELQQKVNDLSNQK